MKKLPLIALVSLLSAGLMLASCQESKKEPKPAPPQPSQNEVLVFAQKTLLGSALASRVAAQYTMDDVRGYHIASQQALESLTVGKSIEWENEKTGNGGTVSPSRYYQTPQGNYCREFTQTLKIKKKQLETSGTACRNKEKIWVLQQ